MKTVNSTIDHNQIPQQALFVCETLEKAGFEAYLVGGCVRDLLMGRKPNDWDITTDARPVQIIPLFEKTVHENNFGTVTVVFEELENNHPGRQIEVTTYRSDGIYTDNRRPDSISYAKDLTEDLKRRDFTINAMAYRPSRKKLIDLYNGQDHLASGVLTTVGNAHDRLSEDALRIMRAVRFAAQLDVLIDKKTIDSILELNTTLIHISQERVRDEFVKLIMSDRPEYGMTMLRDLGLLEYLSNDIAKGVGVDQDRNHIYDVFTHNVKALQHSADKGYPLHVRLAALWHDVAKPHTKRYDKAQNVHTFYGHEIVGAKIVRKDLERLRFPKKVIRDVATLVRYHMFFSDVDSISLSAVRRIITNVGKDLIWDLIHLRYCDRIGMGRPKEDPYRLRKYEAMIEEALRDPISVKMLKLNGDMMIRDLGMPPGPKMGWVLHALLEEVLDDPQKNTLDYLSSTALELYKLPDQKLRQLGQSGKDRQHSEDQAVIAQLHNKHGVRYQG